MWTILSSCVPGQHRSLGPSISKMRSLKLDSSIWSNALVEVRTVLHAVWLARTTSKFSLGKKFVAQYDLNSVKRNSQFLFNWRCRSWLLKMNWSEVKSWKTKTYAPVTVLVCRLWPKISFTGQKLLCISKYFTPTTFSDSPKLFWCVTALSEIVINKCYCQGRLYANLELIFTCICLLFFLLVPSPPPALPGGGEQECQQFLGC